MPYSYDRRIARRPSSPAYWDMESEEATVEDMMDDFIRALPKFLQKGLKVKPLDREVSRDDATVFMVAEYESEDLSLEVRVEQRSWSDADEGGYIGGTDEPEISWSYDDGDGGDSEEITGKNFLPKLRQHVQQLERKHPELDW